MLILIGVVAVVLLAMVLAAARFVRAAGDTSLGWMSEQWLAEHRATNQT